MAQQQLAQSNAALDAFDRLKIQEVGSSYGSLVTLAEFQSAAASLEPDERIKLKVISVPEDSLELLKTVLADPQANKICALHWKYWGKEDVNSVIPLLIDNCPELASLQVDFRHHSEFDFLSSVLEHPSNKIKVLEMLSYIEKDSEKFFAALEQSQVSALTISGDGIVQGLYEYLAKDLLVRLTVRQAPFEMTMSLATCTRLVELELFKCEFSALTHLPKSVTKLVVCYCTFVDGFGWSFLAGSGVRELVIHCVRGVDGKQFGSALTVQLKAKGLDKLHLSDFDTVNETLAAVGREIGRIKGLTIRGNLNEASIELISLVLRSSNSEMKELELPYENNTASSIGNCLVPALRHPNCSLNKLSLDASQEEQGWFREEGEEELEAAAETLEHQFRSRCGLLVLLQGQQVRRKRVCPLRRLPVEMFRLVGIMLV